MKNSAMRRAAGAFRTYRRKKQWQTAVMVLAAVVVFCTTYALILPAITWEKTPVGPVCSLETLGVHAHEDMCYDESGALVCGYADFILHTHEDSCYDEDGNLLCALDEILAHEHTAECYAVAASELVCPMEESDGHTHDETCYDEADNLICGAEETEGHVHTDECYACEQTLVCGQAQIIAHLHEPGCYDENGVCVCGMLEVWTHVHGASCFESGEDGEMTDEPPKKTVPNNPADVGKDSLPVDYYVYLDGEWTIVGATKTGWYGDYTTGDWKNDNRDYITVAQAASILEPYGFDSDAGNAALQLAYQRKEIYADANLHCDTYSYYSNEAGTNVIPLARNDSPASGYNLYFLPANANNNFSITLDAADTINNAFYTVSVYDAMGDLIHAQIIRTGGGFTYDAQENESVSDVTEWLAVYGDGTTSQLSGNPITIGSVTGTITISPLQSEDGTMVHHRVTFKVCVDDEWQEVGSLPYYYSGSVDGQTRAYITSSMAAQILGTYEYTATTAPGYQFGYSYDDIYNILYAPNTGFAMDINGKNFSQGEKVQLWEFNGSDAQTFRIWDTGDGDQYRGQYNYKYITPVTNSSLRVNVTGGGYANGTKLQLYGDGTGSSRWLVWEESDGSVSFWTRNNPDIACIDLPDGNVNNGNQLQIWENGSNRYWRLQQVYRISNNTGSERNDDGTYKIGLTQETNGDIVCYYLPGEIGHQYTDVSEDGIGKDGNRFWSITVRDDNHDVYSEEELRALRWVIRDGDREKVVQFEVLNGPGVSWSYVGKHGNPVSARNPIETDGHTLFSFWNISQPIEVVATEVNPSFTVQYYAYIPRIPNEDAGGDSLTIIDTTAHANGGSVKLPQNGESIATRNLYLEATGQYTNKNAGDQTQLYQVKTSTELIELYTQLRCEYAEYPGLRYFNKLKDNESYTLSEIWVLKPGCNPDSTIDDDWDWYTVTDENISFTNLASEASESRILITNGMVIRLVSKPSTGEYHNDTTFYDYNISSGQNADGRWRTGITGINSKENYGTSRNGKRNWDSGADVLAFGNANCGTGMSGYLFDAGTLNQYNRLQNSDYDGATFGLADSLNEDGTICYNQWIVAPNLFNDGDAAYKQTYAGSKLTFERVGDTYTLSAATLNNSNGQQNTISGLQYFFQPSPTVGYTHTHIFTNDFWPMDAAAGRTDPLMGQYGNTGSFQGFQEGTPASGWSDFASNFPASDDGNAHNWFFGMNFSLSFTLTEDYVGPLEYEFFGDDDMWVFLDGRLICDIGGVHTSIGESVNLRDYLPEGSSGHHTLSFFYTERGASGSTCYMRFTLPAVSSAVTAQDTGSLQISKQIGGVADSTAFANEEFEFAIELLTQENGLPLDGTYSYTSIDTEHPDEANHITHGTVKSGGTIKLRPGWTATIEGIPAGTYYEVEELTTAGFSVEANETSGYIVSGKIATGEVKQARFVNTPLHELPQTGGSGTDLYTMGGGLMIAGAGALVLYNRRKRRRGAV